MRAYFPGKLHWPTLLFRTHCQARSMARRHQTALARPLRHAAVLRRPRTASAPPGLGGRPAAPIRATIWRRLTGGIVRPP